MPFFKLWKAVRVHEVPTQLLLVGSKMSCLLLASGAGADRRRWYRRSTLGEVALNHERSGDGEVRGIGGAADAWKRS